MDLIRQVSLARTVAGRIVGESLADDVAHEVAVVLLEWGLYRWTDATVERLATDLALAEVKHRSRHILMGDTPFESIDIIAAALAAMHERD